MPRVDPATEVAPATSRVLVLGSGLVCPPLISYLTEYGFQITLASRTVSKAESLVASLPEVQRLLVRCVAFDIESDTPDCAGLRTIMADCALAVSLLPYIHHVRAAKIALELNKHFFTTSYISPAMLELDAQAKKQGLCFLQECGLDPGLDHMSAQRIIDRVHECGGRVVEFRSICGGLPSPAANTNPLGYKLSWSPRGVLLASRNAARYWLNGRQAEVSGQALYTRGVGYDSETVYDRQRSSGLDKLELEFYPNRDSTPYRTHYGIPETSTLIRGTYRNAGWCDMMRILSEAGFTETDTELASSTFKHPALHSAQGGAVQYQSISRAQFLYSILVRSGAALSPDLDLVNFTCEKLHVTRDNSLIERLTFLGLFNRNDMLPLSLLNNASCSALDVVCWLFEQHMQFEDNEADMIVMRHTLEVEFDTEFTKGSTTIPCSHREQWTSTLIELGETHQGGNSAMARTVTLPVGIAIRLVLSRPSLLKAHPELLGVIRPVQPVLYNLILDEMANQHGVVFLDQKEPTTVWIRSEAKAGEHRVPITPVEAKELIESQQYRVMVERSPHRCIEDAAYENVGCQLVAEHSWQNFAPYHALVAGLKELPDAQGEHDIALRHRHMMFAHCYKQQGGWEQVLKRFIHSPLSTTISPSTISATTIATTPHTRAPEIGLGCGVLYDLEFLTDKQDRRIAAFGRAAGIVGMALALIQWAHQRGGTALQAPLQPWNNIQAMMEHVRASLASVNTKPSVLVLGALGRCGQGAVWVAQQAGLTSELTQWDVNETKVGGPFPTIATDYELLVNCIYLAPGMAIPPFLTAQELNDAELRGARRLSVVCDVSCDTSNPHNPLPFVNQGTTLHTPILPVSLSVTAPQSGNAVPALPFEVIAIDHLPALIPLEASTDFAAALGQHFPAIHTLFETPKRMQELEMESKATSARVRALKTNQPVITSTNTTVATHPSAYIWMKAEALFHNKLSTVSHSA